MLENDLIKVASFFPKSLQPPASWVGHLPFAAWVVKQVSPKIFVELGTHTGNSYFAFCQSVLENALHTKCYAIDTWCGDEHAGRYEADVFDQVSEHNQENYAGFSTLLRMRFNEAVSHFADESIALLHIDGLHTYEAVREDFETWLPKLALGAVVLFHDTQVYENNFGVWKFWEELRALYPSNLEFLHSHGLGVLQLNNGPQDTKRAWLQPHSVQQQVLIDYFAALGARYTEPLDARAQLTDREQQIADLRRAVKECNRALQTLENSHSWKLTSPLRQAFKFIGPRDRRILKLIGWTITLQLPKMLRETSLSGNLWGVQAPHYGCLTDDFSLAVPFRFAAGPATTPSLAVICHLFYPEMLEEFKRYLSNIPFSFDLFVTTDSEKKKNEIAQGLALWDKGAVDIRIVPNRGRDIAPKLIACRDVYERYEFFLHIHSKKSLHAQALAVWRSYLLETLLGSEEIVGSIFQAFNSDPQLGMIGPQHHPMIREFIGWGWGFEEAFQVSKRMGLRISINGKLDFPTGAMFWGRCAALRPLLELNLTSDDFPPEAGQLDRTLAHTIERLFYFSCEQAGYRWIKVANPIQTNSEERLLWIESKEALPDVIKQVQYGLRSSKPGLYQNFSRRPSGVPGGQSFGD